MHRLDRFLRAQSGSRGATYAQALAELRAGAKVSHWIWYALPQVRALGQSAIARRFGLADRVEAAAYLSHPVLGQRLLECVSAMLNHEHLRAEEIVGAVATMKFRSRPTLFESVAPEQRVFGQARFTSMPAMQP